MTKQVPPEEQEALRNRFYDMLDRVEARSVRVKPIKRLTKPDRVEEGEAIGPTPERMGHYDGGESAFKTETGRIIQRLSVVDALYEADDISAEGYVSVGRYLSDWNIGFGSRTTATLADVVDGSGNADAFNVKRMDAAAKFAAANAFIGKTYATVMRQVVINGDTLTDFAINHLNVPRTSKVAPAKTKAVLIRAINALANFYAPDIRPPKPRRSHAHMQEGARPTIHPFQQDDAA